MIAVGLCEKYLLCLVRRGLKFRKRDSIALKSSLRSLQLEKVLALNDGEGKFCPIDFLISKGNSDWKRS